MLMMEGEVRRRAAKGIVFILGCCVSLCAAEPVPPDAAGQQEKIAQAIRQLGDDNFYIREKATESLWAAGRAAEQALREALKSSDREVVRRAQSILDKFKWGIYPDTPKDIIQLVERYQSGDPAAKRLVIDQLLNKGGAGYLVLSRIGAAQENADERRAFFEHLDKESSRILAQLLVEGKDDTVEEILELALKANTESSYRNYAAYLLLRGKLDDKISQYKTEGGRPEGVATSELLVYLYRAKGDLAGARRAAERLGKRPLLRAILWEEGAWKDLQEAHQQQRGGDFRNRLEGLGFQAAYQRLAGDKKQFETTIAEIRKTSEGKLADEEDGWYCAKTLLLNDKPQEAIDVLLKTKNWSNAFELLSAQMHYREAFEAAAKAKTDRSKHLLDLQINQARTLHLLGEKKKAQALFADLATQIKSATDVSSFVPIVEAEQRLGLKQQALEHCALILARPNVEAGPSSVLESVFPEKGETAEQWWRLLRRTRATEGATDTLKRIETILNGKMALKELKALAEEAEAAAEAAPERQEKWRQAFGEAFQLAGDDGLALGYFIQAADLKSASPMAVIRLGDYLAAKKSWDQAAARYEQAWKKEPRQPLALYLQGRALTRAGREQEGQKLMSLAHCLPLGDESTRYAFAEALDKRDLGEPAQREYALLLSIGQFDSWFISNAHRRVAQAALAKKDYLTAARHDERALLDCLRTGTGFVRNGAYLAVPHLIHRYRARGLLAANRLDEARREIDLALAALPGEVDVPIELAPELEKHGRQTEADDLFKRVMALNKQVCTDYPKSAWAHNTAAWLAARCRRQLDDALEHARVATELSPNDTGYMDTLAEVMFQRGEKANAMELMKQCLEIDPKNPYYRKQLQRFEAGDRAADVPEHGD
jgi:predicted Zn-dependent protease